MHIPVTMQPPGVNQKVETKALIDSAAGGRFIDQNFVRRKKISTQQLHKPIPVYNVDGTPNKQGTIREFVRIPVQIHGRTNILDLFVCGLGRQTMILGMPWLRATNPPIDWRKGTIEWRKPQLHSLQTSRPIKTPKEEETINVAVLCLMEDELDEEGEPTPVWINAKFTTSQTLAAEDYAKKEKKPLHKVVPEPYHNYLALFREETSNLFPPKRPWDHEIKLKEGFTPKIFKTYMLSLL